MNEAPLALDDESGPGLSSYVTPALTCHGSLARQAAGQPGLILDGLQNISFPSL